MQPGTRLKHFTVLEDLGRGGMAAVWAGRDEESGRQVAIKTLVKSEATEHMIPRFVRECEACRKLSGHPHIVDFLDSGVHEDIYFFVMERILGRTLEAVLEDRGRPLQVERSQAIFVALLKALDHAHSLKIIHRDVKPKNIMLTEDDEVKLIDFGIAAAEDNLIRSALGSILGSFCYSSPEQNQGQQVDERSDLYSAGLVLWELLTWRRALDGESLQEVLQQQMTEGIPPPSSENPWVPEELDQICERLLKTDRHSRPQSARELLAILGG